MEIPIQQIANQKLIDLREKRDKEIKSWHASKFGSCLRGMYLERMGVKPDSEFVERELRVFDCGHIFENWFVDLLKNDKDLKIEQQVRVELKDLNISGYADGVISYNGFKKVLEVKSKHSYGFKYLEKDGAQEQHREQVWIYLKGLEIKEGSIIYLSKDDLRIMEFPVYLKDKALELSVMKQVELLNQAWKDKSPYILPLPEKDSWQSKYCRWHSQCLKIKKK